MNQTFSEGACLEQGSSQPTQVQRRCLEWMRHFEAESAMELDLGTLTAIREWVRDGVRPPIANSIDGCL